MSPPPPLLLSTSGANADGGRTVETSQGCRMAKHHPDLIMCRKQPGIAIGRLCEKCDGKCVICDSYVRFVLFLPKPSTPRSIHDSTHCTQPEQAPPQIIIPNRWVYVAHTAFCSGWHRPPLPHTPLSFRDLAQVV